jgi:hypothetical protein
MSKNIVSLRETEKAFNRFISTMGSILPPGASIEHYIKFGFETSVFTLKLPFVRSKNVFKRIAGWIAIELLSFAMSDNNGQ